jgi:hypothetical protein
MLEEIGLASVFVNNTSVDSLMAVRNGLEQKMANYPEEMLSIKDRSFLAYQEALEPLRDLCRP